MKTCAVICELNPFHNGHRYIFEKAREKSGADHIAAIMSGNYVQRGEPAITDKYVRTEAALKGGADIVIEMPAVYSLANAGTFALGGVRIAEALGCTHLAFGVEDITNEESLKNTAELLSVTENDTEFRDSLHSYLKTGLPYPAARAAALRALHNGNDISVPDDPNEILALEYLKAIINTGSVMKTVFVERKGDPYHAAEITNPAFASATALRNIIAGHGMSSELLDPCIPDDILSVFRKAGTPVFPDDLSTILSLRLLDAVSGTEPRKTLLAIANMNEDIAGRLLQTADTPMSFIQRAMSVKARNLTLSGIKRALVCLCLGISKEEAKRAISEKPGHIRLLGFRKSAGPLLKAAGSGTVDFITKPADCKALLSREIYYDQIYYSLKSSAPGEYQRQMIII